MIPALLALAGTYLAAREQRKGQEAAAGGGGGGGGPSSRATIGGGFDSSQWSVVTGSGNRQTATNTSDKSPALDWKMYAILGLGALLAWKTVQD